MNLEIFADETIIKDKKEMSFLQRDVHSIKYLFG